MLDQIIENIIQKIRSEVVQRGMNDIPLAYLYTRKVPDSIKHFFDQEVEIWIREEREKFSASERFDYEMPEVQMLTDKVFDILKQSATFHLNQFNRLLERAIKLEANYLIRPHQTLTQFLFKDSFVVTTIEVYDMLKYFDKFAYYKDALTDYFNLKYLREISQTQFEELITAIDQQVFEKTPVDTALQTVKTINAFINEGRSEPSDVVNTRMLSMVFRDRNLTEFAKLIEQELREGTPQLSLVDLESILRTGRTLSSQSAAAPVAQRVDEIVDIEEDRPEVAVETIDVSETVEMPPEVMEEGEEYEEEFDEEEEAAPEAPPAPETAPTPEPEGINASAVDKLADIVGSQMKGDDLVELDKLISPKHRKRFIKKVFKKREQQYEEFVQLVNNTPTWKHASNLIDEFFYQEGLNPYSKEALEFSDLVYNRYFPKDISVNKGEEFKY